MSERVDERHHLARSTATQTVLTAVSRVTGFARVVVVTAVLGTTFLGNTYQSANTIPNIVFELFAAGALQAVLVPVLVARFDAGDDDGAQRLAGSVLGHALLVLGALAAVGAVTAPWIMRAMVSGVDDAATRADQVSLGTVFLLIFLPQIPFYLFGLVATAVLHARGRFAIPAVAPAVNNVVVCCAYGLFWYMRRGTRPSLDLSVGEIAVLAGGTSLAVVAFCALPITGALRVGFRFRPNLDRSDPRFRALARRSLWAAAFLAMTQVFLAAVLVLGNRVEGGVVGYQVGFTFFLLPHALFALPVLNTLFPDAARKVHVGNLDGVVDTVEQGVRAISYFVLPVAAALAVLARPIAAVALFGEITPAGNEMVIAVLVGFAPGLLGYGLFYFGSRMFYALDDTRTPAVVHAVVVVGGVGAMVLASLAASGPARIGALAWSHSITYLVGAVALGVVLQRRLPRRPALGRILGPALFATVGAAVAMAGVAALIGGGGRVVAMSEVIAAGAVGVVVYVVLQQLSGGTNVSSILRLVRRGGTR